MANLTKRKHVFNKYIELPKEMTYKGALKLLIGEEKTIYEWFYK
jgi:hypothetical protein